MTDFQIIDLVVGTGKAAERGSLTPLTTQARSLMVQNLTAHTAVDKFLNA